MKIKTLIACLGAFITLISGVGFNTLNNQKEVNQNENIIIDSALDISDNKVIIDSYKLVEGENDINFLNNIGKIDEFKNIVDFSNGESKR